MGIQKKLFAIIMSLMMVLTYTPSVAFATNGEQQAEQQTAQQTEEQQTEPQTEAQQTEQLAEEQEAGQQAEPQTEAQQTQTEQQVSEKKTDVEQGAQPTNGVESAKEQTFPVGGWSPAEAKYSPEDIEIAFSLNEGKSKRKAVKGDSMSVFTKGVSEAGYNALSKTQKSYYEEIDQAVLAFMNADSDVVPTEWGGGIDYIIARVDYAELGITDNEEAQMAFYAYGYDHPGYYWLSNSFIVTDDALYLCTDEEYASAGERLAINSLVSSSVKTYAELAEKGTDTLDEIAIIHDLIVNDIDYAYQSDGHTPESANWAHSVEGVFDPYYKQAVCEGYAEAFALIMNYMGIPNYYIVGKADGSGEGNVSGHAWNAVSVDEGKTYLYMDLTWDDFGEEEGYAYTFFGMPSSDFETTHFKNNSQYEDVDDWLYDINEQFTDSFENTYYCKGGFYYDGSADTADFASGVIDKAARSGSWLSFMAPSVSALEEVANELGLELPLYPVSYKGNEYYYTIVGLDIAHVHSWSEPEYNWSHDNRWVTAIRVCQEPNCTVGAEDETVETTYKIIGDICVEDSTIIYTADFQNEDFETQTKEVAQKALGHAWKHVIKKATLKMNGSDYYQCSRCSAKKGTATIYRPTTFKLSTTAYTYSGTVKKPAVTVKNSAGKTLSAASYTVTYSKNKYVGTATAKVTLKAPRYTGTKTLTFKINPKGTSLGKLTPKKKAFTVTWKKQATQTTGYQIQYSTSSKFASGNKLVTVAKTGTTSKTISKLKAKKRYYVRVRTYKTVSGTKYYSAWSAKKYVKTK